MGKTQPVFPLDLAILSMHGRLHAVCMPSPSERSYQFTGLCQLPSLPLNIGSRLPHPSQIDSAAIVRFLSLRSLRRSGPPEGVKRF